MVLCLIRVPARVAEQLQGQPALAGPFVYGEAFDAPKPGLLARLFGARGEDAPAVPKRMPGDEFDLDKLWHIAHFLLTGATGRAEGPLGLLADDRHPLAAVDNGYGPPHLVSAERVAAFAAAAAALSDAQFLARYVPADMPLDDLYLGHVIERGEEDEVREDVLASFHGLRRFVAEAAAGGEAIITYTS